MIERTWKRKGAVLLRRCGPLLVEQSGRLRLRFRRARALLCRSELPRLLGQCIQCREALDREESRSSGHVWGWRWGGSECAKDTSLLFVATMPVLTAADLPARRRFNWLIAMNCSIERPVVCIEDVIDVDAGSARWGGVLGNASNGAELGAP